MNKINKKWLFGLTLPLALFAFVTLSVGELGVGSSGWLELSIPKTYATGSGNGGADSGGWYTDNTVINTCSNGATNYPYCNNLCVPKGTQYRTLTCPSGQVGHIKQQRTHMCPSNTWTAWSTTENTCQTQTCSNGATNYPYCNVCPSGQYYVNGQCTHTPPTCSNGATNFPYCNVCPAGKIFSYGQCINEPTCSNGATNYPYCNVCPSGQYYVNGQCTHTPPTCSNGTTNYPYCNQCPSGLVFQNNTCVNPTCSNGATNYPYCNNNTCSNGATNWPHCNNNVCQNGATNWPLCNNQCVQQSPQTQTISCGYGQTGSITQTRYHSCPSNTWSDWSTTSNTCQTNTCSNGATNYPYCNNNTCTNGTTNYPYCNQCPSGMTYLNGTCTYYNPTCSNGATNYPYCNNNTCSNGATNWPLCNNNVVWCNGVQYYTGYICPTNNLAVSTTGANPLSTTATIYGYVNPYNNNAVIWFDYGTGYSNLQYQTTRQNTSLNGQFTASLSNLQCGTRYYYRAVAQNNVETKYGATLSFTTPNCYVPPVTYGNNLVVTRLVTKIGAKSAQLNGSFINNQNDWNSCVSFFDYGTNYNLGKRTVAQKLYPNYKTNYFSQGIYGLTPNTTYYYRAGATCNDGTKFGQIYKFTTGKIVKNYVAPAPVTIVSDNNDCNCEIPEYMTITIDAMEGEATIGKVANYRISFKNVSESSITNVVVRVVLPDELTIAGADKGQFTVGGKTLVLTIPMLRALEEGSVIVSTNVLGGAKVGQQIVVNAYADYTTPTLKKSGTVNKGEVTAYTISVAGNGTSMNPGNGNNSNTSGYPDWMPQNLLEWLLLIVVVGIFFTALRYLFSAFAK